MSVIALPLLGFIIIFSLLLIMYNMKKEVEKIPKIIHQTAPADKSKWKPVWFECQESWKRLHPDFTYKMWTDEDLDEFMKTEFPDFYENVFTKYDMNIKRIDSARYFILYKYGGIYADMDYKCQHRFFESIPDGYVSIARSLIDFDGGFQNALMISPKEHPYWKCVFKLLEERKDEPNVIIATGPRIISDCANKRHLRSLSVSKYNPYCDHLNDSPNNYPNAKTIHMHTYSWSDEETVIPKQVFLTYKEEYESLHDVIKKNIETMKKNNPDYEVRYYSDKDAEKFINENFPQYTNHYEKLVPGAYKADLLRLLLLFKYGGVYNDIGHLYLVPINKILSNHELVLCKDSGDPNNKNYYLHNAFIASIPENPLIQEAINVVIKNIESDYYGDSCLEPTGPGALGRSYNIYFGNKEYDDIKPGIYEKTKILIHTGNKKIKDLNGKDIINTKFENYYEIVYNDSTKKHYPELWFQRQIYKKQKFLDINGKEYDPDTVEKDEQEMVKKWINNEDIVLEIGCSYGTVSCTLARLCKKLVSLDPDKDAINVCKENMKRQNVNFECLWGTLSRKSLYFVKENKTDYGYTNSFSSSNIPHFSIKDIENKYSLKFNTLVIDCEGCMEQIFRDFDTSQFKKVIYERDNEERCDYMFIDYILKYNGLVKVDDIDRGDGIRNICWNK